MKYGQLLLLSMTVILFYRIYPTVDHATEQKKCPLYVAYTPSHEILFQNWFLDSLQAVHGSDEISLHAKLLPQECLSATFKDTGWTQTTKKK